MAAGQGTQVGCQGEPECPDFGKPWRPLPDLGVSLPDRDSDVSREAKDTEGSDTRDSGNAPEILTFHRQTLFPLRLCASQ